MLPDQTLSFHLWCENMAFADDIWSRVTLINVALGTLGYVALRFLYQIVYYRFFHPLSVFPGPFWGTVTRLWITWHNLNETELPTVSALTKKYGAFLQSILV